MVDDEGGRAILRFGCDMKILRVISLIILNTALVTLAVVLGFALGGALGVPIYLQGFCLLPAALLFNWLSGGSAFAWRTVLVYLLLLSGLGFVIGSGLPLLPAVDRSLLIVLIAMFFPVSSVVKWLERRSTKAKQAAENTDPKAS